MQPITERQPRHGRTRSGARLSIGEELRRQINELDLMTEELFALQKRNFRFVSACLHQQAKKLGAMPARLIRATAPERKVA
jgi:predicted NBD/HSP70 family sugar kinase